MTYPHAIVIAAAIIGAAIYFDRDADAQAPAGQWVAISASQGLSGSSVAWAIHSTGSVKRCAPEPDGLFCREAPFRGDR